MMKTTNDTWRGFTSTLSLESPAKHSEPLFLVTVIQSLINTY